MTDPERRARGASAPRGPHARLRHARGALLSLVLLAATLPVAAHPQSVRIAPQRVLPLVPELLGEPMRTQHPIPPIPPDALATIKEAQQQGDSLGGVVEVIAWGVPPGLGSHVEWDQRLDGRIAQALMSIQAMKGVEVGLGFQTAALPGSQVHDPIEWAEGGFVRPSNHAGGIEGGNTNGEPVVARVAMKPIPTLARALMSVDLATKQPFDAQKERTDSCAVPAAGVVAEAVVAFVLADALLDKTGGDTMDEVTRNLKAYRDELASY